LSFPDIHGAVARVEKEGVVLEPEELTAIASYCQSTMELRTYLDACAGEVDLQEQLEAVWGDAPDTSHVVARIRAIIDPDGSIREREIPELKRLRALILQAQQELKKSADALVNRDETRRYYSTNVPTQRDGRTVLPLKADYRGKVQGIVHEVSSSGATVFVEPEELVAKNNAVTEAENRYRNELLRLLRELSGVCRSNYPLLQETIDYALSIDLIWARARYAIDFACEAPEISEGVVRLREARHPLLGETAVPISVELPEGKRALIVTGPNTGGKTVSLKTVGLLSLMHQFGLEVPAVTGTALPVFSGVYADIGDEQSIEQNLSTFSGHMRNIGRILNSADAHSLVLLDELGSGTDPEEGGALAMAVIDELLEKQPYTIVTTHHGRLKHYGFTNPQALNASVEFDQQSLRPTYRIIPGVPGSSHAIEIAAQMGILRRVTGKAKSYLADEEYDTGRIIRRLTDREQELHREREAAASERARVEREATELEEREARLSRERAEVKQRQIRELDQWAAEARSKLENLVREIREGELTREKTQAVKGFIGEIDEFLGQERDEVREELTASTTRRKRGGNAAGRPTAGGDTSSTATGAAAIEPGAEVTVSSSGKRGTVQRKGKGSTWIVQLGPVKLPVEEHDLVPVRPKPPERPAVSYRGTSDAPQLELDLRGTRLDEAVAAVDRNIDNALMSGVERFGVIHGMGEGILQTGVREHLREHPAVKTYEYAAAEDGGFGKTIVHL
jgi:DNA mismatch repair protein MutS2